jgi:hypothetical protein
VKRSTFESFSNPFALLRASVGAHWTPEGHKLVAERLFGLLSANAVIGTKPGEAE